MASEQNPRAAPRSSRKLCQVNSVMNFAVTAPTKAAGIAVEKEQLRRAVEQVERIESKCDDGVHGLGGDESGVTDPECQALHEDQEREEDLVPT